MENYWQDYKVLNVQTWIDEFNPEEINLDKLQEYLEFIQEAVNRYNSEKYSEWHHVMPKCVDENHKYDNEGVRINGRDHFLAHKLLIECFNGNKKRNLLWASNGMARGKRSKDLTPEDYEFARKSLSEASRSREISEETRLKISNSHKGIVPSEETRKKMSESQKLRMRTLGHPLLGKSFTEEQKKVLSESHKGILHTEEWKNSQSLKMKGNKLSLGKVWITNGFVERFVSSKDLVLEEGWRLGRKEVSNLTKDKISRNHAKSYNRRSYNLICKNCNQKFLGNSPNQRFCESCK